MGMPGAATPGIRKEGVIMARQAAEDRRAAQRKAMLDGGWM